MNILFAYLFIGLVAFLFVLGSMAFSKYALEHDLVDEKDRQEMEMAVEAFNMQKQQLCFLLVFCWLPLLCKILTENGEKNE